MYVAVLSTLMESLCLVHSAYAGGISKAGRNQSGRGRIPILMGNRLLMQDSSLIS